MAYLAPDFNAITNEIYCILLQLEQCEIACQVFDYPPLRLSGRSPIVTLHDDGTTKQDYRQSWAVYYRITIFVNRQIDGSQAAERTLSTVRSALHRLLAANRRGVYFSALSEVIGSRSVPLFQVVDGQPYRQEEVQIAAYVEACDISKPFISIGQGGWLLLSSCDLLRYADRFIPCKVCDTDNLPLFLLKTNNGAGRLSLGQNCLLLRFRASLLDNLVAYYKLDEVDGERFDSSINNLNLSAINTVPNAVGKIGNAALFTAANQESLVTTGTDKTAFSFPNESYSFCLWIYANTITTSFILSKFGIVGQRQYRILFSPTQIRFEHIGAGQIIAIASNSFIPNPLQWYFVAAVYDHSSQTITLYVNNDTPAVAAATGGSATVDAAEFYIGSSNGVTSWFDGRIDEVGSWRRALTSAEIEQLYNNGAGLTYPFEGV